MASGKEIRPQIGGDKDVQKFIGAMKVKGRLNMLKKSSAVFLSGLLSLNALADQEEFNKTISNVGAQGTGNYFKTVEPLSLTCTYGVIYFSGSNFLSEILAAKFAGRKLSRIVYSKDANGLCYLGLAEVE